MPPPYNTPKDAVFGLIEAYRTLDVEEIIRSKDIDMDSQLFWQGLGLPVSAEQLTQSRSAFELNFRHKMATDMNDYWLVSFRLISEEQPEEGWAVVTVAGTMPDGSTFDLKLAVYRSDDGWKVVLHPGFDHL